ncbi:hypothetical protein FB451DRAFT_1262810 [Mycena latifolia]|nr:hypothetical protein FB451DRAFT_1262810 [Mycena latifolia]
MVTSQHIPNPFAAAAPTAEVIGSPSSRTIEVYFPHAAQPKGQMLALRLAANATVEDAIALALWTYWEKRWLPELNASKPRDTNIASWIMLVPGKDGAVNRRIAQNKMSRFNFDNYAIVRAPRNLSEKHKIQMQVANFIRDSPSPATTPERHHTRPHSLPLFKSGSEGRDAPISFSKLPCEWPMFL